MASGPGIEGGGVYEFGPFRLDPMARLLLRGDDPVTLKPKVLDTLLVLVAAEGRLVPREELLDAVWPDVVVEPGNLDGNVAAIRRAFGSDASVVETQRGRGYRIAVPVTRRARGVAAVVPGVPGVPGVPAGTAPEAGPAPPLASWPVRRPRLLRLLAAAAVLVGLGTLVAVRASVRPGPLRAAPRRVAVLSPSNLSGRGEDAWLASALRETLRAELSSVARVETLPAETVRRVTSELDLADSGSFSRETLARFRAGTGADVLVSGSYLVGKDGSLRVDVSVEDCRSGNEIGTLTETGNVASLLPLLASAGARLRGLVGAGEGKGYVAEGLPRSPTALRLYVEGIDHLASFETAAARDLLVEAIAEEPSSALVRVALAEAWEELGYTDRARTEAEAALGLTKGLPRAAELAVEARAHLVAGRAPEAIARFRALLALHPESLEDGLLLSRALRQTGQAAVARDVVAALKRLPPPAGTDPRLDLEEALIARSLGEREAGLRLAERAEARAREAGLPLLLSRALRTKSASELGLEDDEASRRSAAEGAQLASRYADASLEVDHLKTLGWTNLNLGDRKAAAEALERGLSLARRSGSPVRIRSILGPLSDLRLWEGDLDEARALVQERIALSLETGSRGDEVYSQVWLADLERMAGNLPEAEKAADRALSLSRDGAGYLGEAARTSAELALATGRPDEALALADQEARAFAGAGPGARSTASRLRARALLALGREAEAEKAASQAVTLLESSRRPFQLAGARALWALTLAAAGQPARARSVLARERESWPRLAPVELLLARLEEAKAQAALGDGSAARTALQAVASEAAKGGLGGIADEASRALRPAGSGP